MSKSVFSRHNISFTLVKMVFLVVVFFMVFVHAMQTPIDHDEHQYIAAAKLTADQGLLPYDDYRFVHMPYSVFINAVVFSFTDYLLSSARLLNAISFFGLLLLLFSFTRQLFADKNRWIQLALGAGAISLLLFNPVVQNTMGKSWTFDLPLLISTGAVLMLFNLHSGHTNRKLFVIGLLLALATGIRFQFVFIAFAVFVYILWNYVKGALKGPRPMSHLVAGGLLAILPLLLLAANQPGGFIFDIYTFHAKIDLQYKQQELTFIERSSRLGGKLLKNHTAIIVALAALFVGGGFVFRQYKTRKTNEIVVVFLFLLPALLFIALGKIVLFQYLYPLVVFTVFVIVAAFAGLGSRQKVAAALFSVLVVLNMVLGIKDGGWNKPDSPEQWTAMTFNGTSKDLAKLCKDCLVLTLSPAAVLESPETSIYPEFVTTPFIWRASALVPEDLREAHQVVTFSTLEDFLEQNPPDAIVTGFERPEYEQSFVNYAKKMGYTEENLNGGKVYIKKLMAEEVYD